MLWNYFPQEFRCVRLCEKGHRGCITKTETGSRPHGEAHCASSLLWSSTMVGRTNINNIVARQSSLQKCVHRLTAPRTDWMEGSPHSRTVVCSVYVHTPLLRSALWCGNWFDSHFFPPPPASWILDSAKRGYRKSKQTGAAYFQRAELKLKMTTEMEERQDPFIWGWAKWSQKTPKSRLPNIKYYKKTTGKRPTGS